MKLPRLQYTVNTATLELPAITIYFSYETPIAFNDYDGEGFVIRENDWSTTTGKHLNAIDSDHSVRIPGDKFNELLEEALA